MSNYFRAMYDDFGNNTECNRGSCVDCEEQDAVIIDQYYKDELCSTCYTKRLKQIKKERGENNGF